MLCGATKGGVLSGPTPKRRACPECETWNPPDAGFCWRCATPLIEETPPDEGPSQEGNGDAIRRQRGRIVGASLAVIVLALIVAAFFLNSFRSGIQMPERIDGLPKIDSPEMQSIEQGLDSSGFSATGAAYGSGGRLAFVVVAGEGRSQRTIDELFLEFLGGEMQPAGGSRGGVEFRCAPVADPFRAACMWREGDQLGIVVAVDRDVEATRELLFRARSAIGS